MLTQALVGLAKPFVKRIARDWERAFVHELPPIVDAYASGVTSAVNTLYNNMHSRLESSGYNVHALSLIGERIQMHGQDIADQAQKARKHLAAGQKRIHRDITPVIAGHMGPVYAKCMNESGKSAAVVDSVFF